MHLRQLMITRKLEELRGKLSEEQTKLEDLMQRRTALDAEESELTELVNDVTAESSEEEKTVVDEKTNAWKEADETLSKEEQENAQKREELQNQISELETELQELNERAKGDPNATPEKKPENAPEHKNERNDRTMNKFIRKMFESAQERSAFFAREDVKGFVARVRELKGQNRSITGAELTIPDIMLPLIRQRAEEASKLLKHVSVRNVNGTSRANILGVIPEAVWTEACATLNELAFGYSNVEMDGFKVGGFIPVCNAILEDSDENLAAEVMNMIGMAIGLALDKAILYGTGVKMPLGIVTRINQTSKPSDYPETAYPWVDLHTTNRKTIESGTTGLTLFQSIVADFSAAKSKYASGAKFWAMNETTWNALQVAAMSINAAGAIVSGQGMTMPVIGGAIELLDFMPDGEIVGGYGELYVLAERSGIKMAVSADYKFVEDQTVFKGTARYDGKPAIPEGFVIIAIGDVSDAMSFAEDKANTEGAELTSLTLGTSTLTPAFDPKVTNYTLSVANATSTLKFSSVAKNAKKGAVVAQANGETAVAQGENASLEVGANTLTATVVYGTTTKKYTVVVTRAGT